MHISDTAALGYAISQLAHVSAEVREAKYGHIVYPELAPLSYEASEWATSIETHYMDGVTEGKDIGSDGDDIPYVNMETSRDQLPINLAGIGYSWNLEEVKKAAALRVNLPAVKASLAQRGFEEHAQQRLLTGDPTRGIEGLFNHSGVPTGAAAQTFAAALAGANPGDDAAGLVNEAINAVWTDTLQIHMPNTVLLPTDIVASLATTRLGSTTDTTVMKFIAENNIYTLSTGQALTIKPLPHLTGTNDKMVVYENSAEVLKYHIPSVLQFLTPQLQNLKVKVPGTYKLAGLEVFYPGAFSYRTGI